MEWMDEIASTDVLQQAYAWLCDRRKKYSHNNDVWDLRWRWHDLRPLVQAQLRAGDYRFAPLRRVYLRYETLEVWSARDALVLKALALVLTAHWLPHLSPHWYHLQGRDGAKAAVRFVASRVDQYLFVFRTDVRKYYASIDHDLLLAQLQARVHDARVLELVRQYLRRTVYDGGRYEDVQQGIPLGCPLSPLIGAVFLDGLDQRMAALRLTYARFMDDWVVLAPSRSRLRTAVRQVNQILAELHLRQHPDKTFIGRVSRGFDFLGYAFTPAGLFVAPQALARFRERLRRLYEQGAGPTGIGAYVRRWLCWLTAGLADSW